MTKAIPPHVLEGVMVGNNNELTRNPGLDQSVQDLVRTGQVFGSHDSSFRNSLDEATEYAGNNGVVASLPYLIAGKAAAEHLSYLWSWYLAANSQEYFGIDRQGKLLKPGSPTLIIVHGGSILTPKRMRRYTSYEEAKISSADFKGLLEGRLSEGDEIDIYTIQELRRGLIPDPFGKYGVVLDSTNISALSGDLDKKDFMENPLVLARAGTMEYLDGFFDKTKGKSGKVGNHELWINDSLEKPFAKSLILKEGSQGFCGVLPRRLDRYVAVRPEESR
jgi:hypothetical protein